MAHKRQTVNFHGASCDQMTEFCPNKAMTRAIALLAAMAALAASATAADAAVWRWGCKGQFGKEQVVFNRQNLLILPAGHTAVDLEKTIFRDSLVDDVGDGGSSFDAESDNSGFGMEMKFTKNSEAGEKLTLTEKSSRIASKRSGRAGPRDEITTTFAKTYRFALDGAPPRVIAMQCMEYILTTRSGR